MLTHIDCFSGPGGICTGFRAAGIQTLIAIEYVKSCVETYAHNHPHVNIIHKDMRDVRAAEILAILQGKQIDIVTSGMPCETFSTAGNSSRSFYDHRQFLFREAIRIAKIVNAKAILFENVPAITSKRASKDSGELIIEILARELEESGYGNQRRFILNAADYGVPQRRKRFFLLALNNREIELTAPEPVFTRKATVKNAFAGLPDVVPNTTQEPKNYSARTSEFAEIMRDISFWKMGAGRHDRVSYQTPMKHRQCTIERFSLLEQGESLKDLFLKFTGAERQILQAKRVLPRKMYIQRNYRLIAEDLSPTLTSHCLDELVHPDKNRALTVRECARLQSFPDCYDFIGGPFIVPHINKDVQDKYEQIGDAVPPLLAHAWGRHLNKILGASHG